MVMSLKYLHLVVRSSHFCWRNRARRIDVHGPVRYWITRVTVSKLYLLILFLYNFVVRLYSTGTCVRIDGDLGLCFKGLPNPSNGTIAADFLQKDERSENCSKYDGVLEARKENCSKGSTVLNIHCTT